MSPFRGQFSGKPQIWDYRTSGWRLSNNVTSRVVTSRCQGVALLGSGVTSDSSQKCAKKRTLSKVAWAACAACAFQNAASSRIRFAASP